MSKILLPITLQNFPSSAERASKETLALLKEEIKSLSKGATVVLNLTGLAVFESAYSEGI